MPDNIIHKVVAVGVAYDPERGFLLRHNERWNKFAFFMKQSDADHADAALASLDEDIQLKFPSPEAHPIDVVGAYGRSDGTGSESYYEYHVHELVLGHGHKGRSNATEAKYFSYQELMSSDDVSWSTKSIAQSLCDSREVVMSVVYRDSTGEYLFVKNAAYGYSLPMHRRKTDESPESVALQTLAVDFAFTGPATAKWNCETQIQQRSDRFGENEVTFRIHICRINFPNGEAEDAFAESLRRRDAESADANRWLTGDQVQKSEDVSPTVKSVWRSIEATAGPE